MYITVITCKNKAYVCLFYSLHLEGFVAMLLSGQASVVFTRGSDLNCTTQPTECLLLLPHAQNWIDLKKNFFYLLFIF